MTSWSIRVFARTDSTVRRTSSPSLWAVMITDNRRAPVRVAGNAGRSRDGDEAPAPAPSASPPEPRGTISPSAAQSRVVKRMHTGSTRADTAATTDPTQGIRDHASSCSRASGITRAGPLRAVANRRRRGLRPPTPEVVPVTTSAAVWTNRRKAAGEMDETSGTQRIGSPIANDHPSRQSRAGDSSLPVRMIRISGGRPRQQPSTERLSTSTRSAFRPAMAREHAKTCWRKVGP
jgi:hypothetical protein